MWGDPTGSFFSGFSGSADLLPPGAFIWSKTESFVFLCSQNKCLPCFQPLWAPGVSGAPRPAVPASSAPALCGDVCTARPPPRRGAKAPAAAAGAVAGTFLTLVAPPPRPSQPSAPRPPRPDLALKRTRSFPPWGPWEAPSRSLF